MLVDVAALVESGHSNQMTLTIVLADSASLNRFSAVFTATTCEEKAPTHLHFHVSRILQGTVGIPETGRMYRVAIDDVSARTVGDFSYSDQ
ncbi:hypothetical protein [Streptomyces endocoffeicus]|uniref:hypothetical protein n=1 Tax=Streptomyces endocoffeicus TaxID=2898945 RepID=UPI001E320E05|nr:hypothetical protein [Streptomyces endocoffeicus]